MKQIEFCADSCDRIDKLVAQEADITRSSAVKVIEGGGCLVNNNPVSKNYKTKNGDNIVVILPDPEPADVVPQNIPIDIIYEDADLLVVNKPKGMVVHPAPGNPDSTLVNALLYHCADSLSGINGVVRPGIVHRIDKDTSGLLIVAKNDTAHNSLAEQIKNHSFTRKYEAVAYGSFKDDTGRVVAPIGRHPVKRKQMAVTDKNSRYAATNYRVIGRYNGFTHLEFTLETGRTHQIRVHSAYIGHPLAGDPLYGPKKVIGSLCGQCLHARVIGFVHPSTGEYMEFTSDLPDYFTSFLKLLKEEI